MKIKTMNISEYKDEDIMTINFLEDEIRDLKFVLNSKNQEIDEYRSRINKAIEYIGNPLDNYWEEEAKYLLNILKGEDNGNE